ncbi:phosphatidylinositol N-acetylglucosaminyltransferase [Aspergillus eucalypticola CBS 122712]|uniref:Phosphatidylinositol N-acetylglucosaminyltransferase n=1 Tax=Aspergillus eucalypticola (strain CBS 122712 / IBT 29274) TaxID=1448314 RepID=A0A317V0I5_ASPEC|nr:phosphatidylinositol N-acetylglucosaminyltransferase [Aspergillus eucalypticola CBS 122712]PWY66588.1 phosphatidylinositol N-acetylglucosaminyltransferase [Aspergillus eucalypticola CBS 122712]
MPSRLDLRRPSPTTVSFTVSNASRRTSTPAKAFFYLQISLRAVIFFCVLLLDAAKFRRTFFMEDGSWIRWTTIWSSALGISVCRIADAYSSAVVVLASAIVLYGVFRKGYTEESLLVIRGLGIQTSTSSQTYLSKASTRFIPTTQIQDIVIHEAFKGFEVRFYLAVIVEGESEVVVVFPKLLPNRQILEEVWRGSRSCLYDSKS